MQKPHISLLNETEPFVFVSGQLALDETFTISAPDIDGQTTKVVGNIEKILRQAGLGLSDVIKTTVWLKNASDFWDFDTSYARAFGSHRPARSTVVSELVIPSALVEIEAIARRPR